MMWNFNSSNPIAAKADNGQTLSYSELLEVKKQIQDLLLPRSLVLCLCKNTIGSLAGYATFLEKTIVPILVSDEIEKTALQALLEKYHPNYLWIPSTRYDKFPGYSKVWHYADYSLLKADNIFIWDINPELALLLPTSGSLGSPKLVRQSYQNIISNARSIVEYLEIKVEDRPITTLPMHYTYGLSIINSHLLAGATILLTDKTLLQPEFWHFFREEKASSFGGVPYTYEILKRLRFTKMELPSLRTITQAGGKLPTNLHQEMADYATSTGRRFFVMYGQTEATARMSYLPWQDAKRKIGSMGIAIPGGAFSLHDEDGKIITEANVVGELVYRGENVSLGYAECGDDLHKGDENNACLITGDMAYRDEEGYHYITGRKKRFLKIFGNRINLDEVEQLLKVNFTLNELACTGKDDLLISYLVDEKPDDEQVIEFLHKKTNLHPSAFKVKRIAEIPKSEAGKVLYGSLE